MMQSYDKLTTISSLDKLTHIISRLPSIGEKTAMRLAIYLFNCESEYLEDFAESLNSLHENIKLCKKCFSLSETEVCSICENDKRDNSIICVIESFPDMLAIERTKEYNGVYHVLGNLIAPLKGIGISDIKIKELLDRTKNDDIKEIILAFSASLEADTTAGFIYKKLIEENFKGKITRITYGISLGSDIENADSRSLGRSLIDRLEIE